MTQATPFCEIQTADSEMAPYRRIGQGCCGSVWASQHGTRAIKREDGGPGRSLLNDYQVHCNVLEVATKEELNVCVPRWPEFVRADDHIWWDANLHKFPKNYTTCNALCSERIPPLTKQIRENLIDLYCPAASAAMIKANEADQDCLVRLYLGRRKLQNANREGGRKSFFTLRNFPLYLNQAENLDLDIQSYARGMAEALSMMHWTAKTDANDVEFVLGESQGTGTGEFMTNSFLGSHSLWLLDFDCCRPMTMDTDGVEKAAAAFLRNDPYFPRPVTDKTSPDNELWRVFSNHYLRCSRERIDGTDISISLPERFVLQVEEMCREGTLKRSPLMS